MGNTISYPSCIELAYRPPARTPGIIHHIWKTQGQAKRTLRRLDCLFCVPRNRVHRGGAYFTAESDLACGASDIHSVDPAFHDPFGRSVWERFLLPRVAALGLPPGFRIPRDFSLWFSDVYP